jgi:hypothetical protein
VNWANLKAALTVDDRRCPGFSAGCSHHVLTVRSDGPTSEPQGRASDVNLQEPYVVVSRLSWARVAAYLIDSKTTSANAVSGIIWAAAGAAARSTPAVPGAAP